MGHRLQAPGQLRAGRQQGVYAPTRQIGQRHDGRPIAGGQDGIEQGWSVLGALHGQEPAAAAAPGARWGEALQLIALVQPIQLPPQGFGARWVVGPIQQHLPPLPAAELQPSGPACLLESQGDGLLGDRPPLGDEAFGHGHGHGPVAALKGAWQSQGQAPFRLAGQGACPAQHTAAPLGLPFQHLRHRRRLRTTDGHLGRGQHPGLLCRDLGQGGSQKVLMVEADGAEPHHPPVGMGCGGIESAPQPHLQHHQIQFCPGEAIHGRGREQLKDREGVLGGQGKPAPQIVLQGLPVYPLLAQLYPFAPALQMGGSVNPRA